MFALRAMATVALLFAQESADAKPPTKSRPSRAVPVARTADPARLLRLLEATTGHPNIPGEWRACASDGDCKFVVSLCGESFAIHRKFVVAFSDLDRKTCGAGDVLSVAREAVCRAGRCELLPLAPPPQNSPPSK